MTHLTSSSSVEKKTTAAFLWTNIFKAPFWAIYGLLSFILYKDLQASSFQVALFLTLKPVVSVFSIYWSSFVYKRRDRLIPNIVAAGIIGYLPFFFFPFVDNVWFFIGSGALYMMLSRGIFPAWLEILKINLPDPSRAKIFSYGSLISYVGAIVIPLLIGDLLDTSPGIWRWLFPGAALFSLAAMFLQLRIPIPPSETLENFQKQLSPLQQISHPWKEGWSLLLQRIDFRQFQIGFLLGGSGLMIMQPALPQFFFDSLHISYTKIAVAVSVYKGIGFALTTPFWTSLIRKINLFRFSALVTLLAILFPLLLIAAKQQLVWLYIAYLGYGVMQAGSELSWHLSGPIFAKNEESSLYSSINVATVGLRGIVAPFFGSLLCSQLGPTGNLLCAAFLCLLATLYMGLRGKEKEVYSS